MGYVPLPQSYYNELKELAIRIQNGESSIDEINAFFDDAQEKYVAPQSRRAAILITFGVIMLTITSFFITMRLS